MFWNLGIPKDFKNFIRRRRETGFQQHRPTVAVQLRGLLRQVPAAYPAACPLPAIVLSCLLFAASLSPLPTTRPLPSAFASHVASSSLHHHRCIVVIVAIIIIVIVVVVAIVVDIVVVVASSSSTSVVVIIASSSSSSSPPPPSPSSSSSSDHHHRIIIIEHQQIIIIIIAWS